MTNLLTGNPFSKKLSGNTAVSVEHVTKSFRIYAERNQSLKSAVMRRKHSTYEDFLALSDVSLEIPEGSAFGLMGPNGSGKSTLLKCIAKILQPNQGAIHTRGRLAAMLELGSGFHPELTGRDNVYLNGSILGMTKQEIDAKFEAITEFAGVGAFIDQPVKNYSSGMYVRLGFSVAIHVEPDILLVDEILAVGDMQFQERCAEKFAEFKEQGRTVVVVSHGLGDLKTFCDTAAWLDHGKVVEVGPAAAIVDRYVEAGHSARPTDNGGSRHGSGEIEIEQVELLGGSGKPGAELPEFRTGDPMTIRLHYRAASPVVRPVFGVSINTVEGLHVWSHHTLDARFLPAKLSGGGSIDIQIPAIPLQPGAFDVNTSVVDESLSHSYDQWARGARFNVHVGKPRESGGLVAMNSSWTNLQPPTEMALDAR